MSMRLGNFRYSPDPDDISAQIDLIGVLGPMIGGKPSAAPNGGDARLTNVERQSRSVRLPRGVDC
jgi:hypothetical protein